MEPYKTKQELIEQIQTKYSKYDVEFDTIPENLKDYRIKAVDRTPAENLAYQIGWTTLVLQWEHDEQAGKEVKTPHEQFKWNQLGELYQWFYKQYANQPLAKLREQLGENVTEICEMIDGLTDVELFEPHKRIWADEATKTAIWPVSMFIHVNTVAPVGTFRTKIRK